MISHKDRLEEIEVWASEPSSVIFRHIGQRLADIEPLGFLEAGFMDFKEPKAEIEIAKYFFEKRLHDFCKSWPSMEVSSESKFAFFIEDMIERLVSPAPTAPMAVLVAREIIDRATIGTKVDEGVTDERSDPVSEESKLDGAALAPIFEGELNREAMARALDVVLAKEGLSERKAAAKVGVGKNDITRARNGTASIEKTTHILTELGYAPRLTIPD
ncbi:hypothetical protein ABMC89_13455 [Sulfitobacter sp. HNIBRBA3233]|uniref:hypothetical protein n=1 Tax=Sulfitobacter marinivivus TaxID=3158558 RepID=UPI0032DF1A62